MEERPDYKHPLVNEEQRKLGEILDDAFRKVNATQGIAIWIEPIGNGQARLNTNYFRCSLVESIGMLEMAKRDKLVQDIACAVLHQMKAFAWQTKTSPDVKSPEPSRSNLSGAV